MINFSKRYYGKMQSIKTNVMYIYTKRFLFTFKDLKPTITYQVSIQLQKMTQKESMITLNFYKFVIQLHVYVYNLFS